VTIDGYGLDIGFSDHLYTPLRNTSNYTAIANLYSSHITTATASNSGDSSGSHVVAVWWIFCTWTPVNCKLNYSTIFSQPSLQSPTQLPTLSWSPQLAWGPRYMASGRIQQKTLFLNNSSVVVEVCLPCHCIETAVFLLLCLCSYPWEPVYRVVAEQWIATVAPLFQLSGIMSQYYF
jgi:hypothetical protein